MATFHMETDAVRVMEIQFRQLSEQILNHIRTLSSAIYNIDWVGIKEIDRYVNFTLYKAGSVNILPLQSMFFMGAGSQAWKASQKMLQNSFRL